MSDSSEARQMRRILSDHALLSIPEVAEALSCSAPTAVATIERNQIPTIGVGDRRKVDPLDLYLYIVAEREGRTVEQYIDAHGEATAVENAKSYYRRVRRFVA